MKVKAILHIYDGVPYHAAFRFTLTSTGRRVVGTVSGGESNISAVFNHCGWRGLEWSEIYYSRQTLGKREYDNLTADWPYAGCPPGDIKAFIERELRKRRKPE